MPPGNESKHDYSEFDFSGIMTMIMNAKFIQREIAGPYDAKTFQSVSIQCSFQDSYFFRGLRGLYFGEYSYILSQNVPRLSGFSIQLYNEFD